MKRPTDSLSLAFVCAAALLFIWSWMPSIPAAKAAPDLRPLLGSSANYALDWSAFGNVSGGESASANYHLSGTIGQMAAGSDSASTHYAECSGFQCVFNALHTWLPLLFR